MTRREFAFTTAAAAAAPKPQPWTTKWDRALILAAVEKSDAAFDPKESMLAARIGPEYRYHTNLRSTTAHSTRASLEYAFLLLEAGGEDRIRRAIAIIDRLLAIQETDPASKWYGLWGYYLEEPAPKMSPADWNWADFNGSVLLMIEARHRHRLSAALRARIMEGIRHAAVSVRRRNVSMSYTNIAVQGTFVTLAAAELLHDDDLLDYAVARWRRFARTVDETGSFAEYNSPTYANVTIANLTRIRMFVKHPDALALTERIHHRVWLHVGKHWHAPTRQIAGPMSRCYNTDLGAPLWIQKALRGKFVFATLDQVSRDAGAGEVGVLDYRCPAALEPLFLQAGPPRQHREQFLLPDVQGTTYLHPKFCLGSINRGNFWVQSRPLLAYWGGPERPARYMQARLMKDGYDFASALFFSVQDRNRVIALVTFRSPGGDKHPSLDPIKDGQFTASRLRLRFDFAGVPENAQILVNGKPADGKVFEPDSTVAMDLGGEVRIWIQPYLAACGEPAGRISLAREEGLLTLSVDLLNGTGSRLIRWPQDAGVLFAMAMEAGPGTLADFDRRCRETKPGVRMRNANVSMVWNGLSLAGIMRSTTIEQLNALFKAELNGGPIPLEKLSRDPL